MSSIYIPNDALLFSTPDTRPVINTHDEDEIIEMWTERKSRYKKYEEYKKKG